MSHLSHQVTSNLRSSQPEGQTPWNRDTLSRLEPWTLGRFVTQQKQLARKATELGRCSVGGNLGVCEWGNGSEEATHLSASPNTRPPPVRSSEAGGAADLITSADPASFIPSLTSHRVCAPRGTRGRKRRLAGRGPDSLGCNSPK